MHPLTLVARAIAPHRLKRLWHSGRRLVRGRGGFGAPWLIDATVEHDSVSVDASFFSSSGLSPAASVIHRHLRRANDLARMAYLDDLTAFVGIEWRQPYLDRRLVEFCLSLPQNMFCHRGEDRVVLRRAMRGYMPERLRRRRTYANFYGLIRRGFRLERERINRCWNGRYRQTWNSLMPPACATA